MWPPASGSASHTAAMSAPWIQTWLDCCVQTWACWKQHRVKLGEGGSNWERGGNSFVRLVPDGWLTVCRGSSVPWGRYVRWLSRPVWSVFSSAYRGVHTPALNACATCRDLIGSYRGRVLSAIMDGWNSSLASKPCRAIVGGSVHEG